MQLSYSENSILKYETNMARALDKNIVKTVGELAGETVDLNSVSESLVQAYSEVVEENFKSLIDSFENKYGLSFDIAGLNAIDAIAGRGKMRGAAYHYAYAQWYYAAIEKLSSAHLARLIGGAELPDLISMIYDFEEICSAHALSNRVKYYLVPEKKRKSGKFAYLGRCSLPYGAVNSEALTSVCRAYFKDLPKSGIDSKMLQFNAKPSALAAQRCTVMVEGLIGGSDSISYEVLFEGVEAVRTLQCLHFLREETGNTISHGRSLREEATIIALRDRLISVSSEDRFYELFDAPAERYVTFGGTVIDEFENNIERLSDIVKAEIGKLE